EGKSPMSLHIWVRYFTYGQARKSVRRRGSASLKRYLELLEDRLAPATLHWTGADAANLYLPGLEAWFFNTLGTPDDSFVPPAVTTNPNWIGNANADVTATLTGPISFPNLANGGAGFTDNNTNPAFGTTNTVYTTIGNTGGVE